MKHSSTECPVCGAADCRPSLDYPDFPAFLFPMSREKASAIEKRHLGLHLCPECGHLFQAEVDQALLSLIYGDYYANYPYDGSEAMNQAYRRPFDLFCELMLATHASGANPRLLEIGCSRPDNMLPFAAMGYECVGVDPSPLADGQHRHEGIRLVSGYYEQTPLDGEFDVIVSRFNLEHIPDLRVHLGKMNEDLKHGGRAIVQVPNVAYYLENLQPLFVAHEHIHYFSLNSLMHLFEAHGLMPVSCYAAGQPSLLACFKKGGTGMRVTAESATALLPAFQANIAAKAKELAEQLSDCEHVVFYGCGLALFWALHTLADRLPGKVVVVDDNPALIGKNLPVYGLPVESPDPARLADAELVVLTLNPIYHERVVARLNGHGIPMTLLKIGTERLERVDLLT